MASGSAEGSAGTSGAVLVGTYGFGFGEWAGAFYPKGLPANERLRHYATVFGVVEMNGTYHRIPKASDVARWRDLTPEHFIVSAKAPRFLVDAIGRMDRSLPEARRVLCRRLLGFVDVLRPLGPRLGPIVLQLREDFMADPDSTALGDLLDELTESASEPLPRLAIEFRHPSWLASEETVQQLRDRGVAWVWNDRHPEGGQPPSPIPRAIDDPAALKISADDFAYVRLSGSHEGKTTHLTPKVDRLPELQRWADLVRHFLDHRPDRTAYVMISDHYAGVGPETARHLQQLLASG